MNIKAKFEIGKTYITRSICDSDCVITGKVVRRTAQSELDSRFCSAIGSASVSVSFQNTLSKKSFIRIKIQTSWYFSVSAGEAKDDKK